MQRTPTFDTSKPNFQLFFLLTNPLRIIQIQNQVTLAKTDKTLVEKTESPEEQNTQATYQAK